MSAVVAMPDVQNLTPQDKYRLFVKKHRCEVKILRKGKDPIWVPATIEDKPNKGGAYCRPDTGGVGKFFHWNEIRPSAETTTPRMSASLGEMAGSKLLRALPPYLDTQDEAKPTDDPVVSANPPEAKSGVLISTKELAAAAAMSDHDDDDDKHEPRRQRHSHKLTPIGDLFRRKRLEKGQSQLSIAEILGGTTNSRISQIELGKAIPTDNELQAFTEAFRLDLDEVLRLRDESIETRVDRRLKEHRSQAVPATGAAAAPEATAPDVPPPAPEPSSTTTLVSSGTRAAPLVNIAELSTADTQRDPLPGPRPASDDAEAFAEFCLDLGAVAPVPRGDVERRKLWFSLSRRLFELNRQ